MNLNYLWLYNFAILALCTYMVGWMGWSPWWFAGAILLLKDVE